MTNNKPTLKYYYEELLTLPDVQKRPDLMTFIEDRINKLVAKQSVKKTNEKAIQCRKDVLDALAKLGRPVTVTELLTEASLPYSSSAVTSALTAMRNDKPNGSGEVVRTINKRIAYFSLAD